MTTRTDTKNSIKKISQVINLLGRIMGLVIKEQEGIDLLNKVEKVRQLSKAARSGNKAKFNELKKYISKLSPRDSLIVARSFNQFLNIANLVENVYSVHKVDNYNFRKAQGTNEFIVLEDAISHLLKDTKIIFLLEFRSNVIIFCLVSFTFNKSETKENSEFEICFFKLKMLNFSSTNRIRFS